MEWIDDPQRLKEGIFLFFKNNFSELQTDRPTFSSSKFKQLTGNQLQALWAPIMEEEIKNAVWICEGSKVPGRDGFTFTFIKKHRLILKEDIVAYVKEFERSGKLAKGCNSTFVTLILKVVDPLTLHDFRPIRFVGSQYKIIAKVLAQRLKVVLPSLVSENQSAFVADRQIIDVF